MIKNRQQLLKQGSKITLEQPKTSRYQKKKFTLLCSVIVSGTAIRQKIFQEFKTSFVFLSKRIFKNVDKYISANYSKPQTNILKFNFSLVMAYYLEFIFF